MSNTLLFAVSSAGCFLALAHAAVSTPRATFLKSTVAMACVGALLLVVSPAAGIALLAPVLFSRRFARAPIPATVPELFGSYSDAKG